MEFKSEGGRDRHVGIVSVNMRERLLSGWTNDA